MVIVEQVFRIATSAYTAVRGLQVSYARVLHWVNFRESGLKGCKFVRTTDCISMSWLYDTLIFIGRRTRHRNT